MPAPIKPRAPGRRCGFTLIEAALVTVIIGVGVIAMLQLLAAGTMSNGYAADQTTAVNLANNIHEISLGMSFYDPDTPNGQTPVWNTKEGSVAAYDNVLDLDGCSFSPPLDVRRQTISAYSNWTQQVSVKTVAHDQVNSVRPNTTSEPTAVVTVTILHNGKQVYTTNWLAVAPAP